MANKLTTEIFIERARKVHGDKYDYSKVEYVDVKTKVCIICPIHGEFWQRYSHHTEGRGCSKCAAEKNGEQLLLWTEEKCREHASHYSTMKDFREGDKNAYNSARKHGWLKDYTWLAYKITSSQKKKDRHVYTHNEIIERLKSLFGTKYGYDHVVYKNMKTPIVLFCHECDENGVEHGEFSMRPNNIFSGKQSCPKCWQARRGIIQLLPVEEFIKRSNAVHHNLYEYHKVEYKGTNKKVCIKCPIHGDFWQTPSNHMLGKGCPYCSGNAKKWNKETCKEEARKYEYIHDFRTKSSGACNVAQRNGWLNEYTWLKKLPPKTEDYTKETKYIYAYEFVNQNAVYVGLTNSIIKRDWQHRNSDNSTVFKFAKECKCEVPRPIVLESGIPINESGEREFYWVENYRNTGWYILNKAKTGKRESSIGATFPLKWNKKTIREKAKECNYDIKLFMQQYLGAYGGILSRYRGLLNELFPDRMIHTHHTLEEALQVAAKGNYENRSQLRYDCLWAYRVLFESNKLDDIFGTPKEYTREEALEEANDYNSIEQIRVKNHTLWNYLKNNDLFRLAKPTDAMFRKVKNVDEAWALSMYYNSMTELSNHAKSAYRILKENGLLQKRYPHSVKYSSDNWSREKCLDVAKECASKTEFKKKYPIAYKYAKRNNWMSDYTWFAIHTNVLSSITNPVKADYSNVNTNEKRSSKVYWTFDRCYKEAQKYTSKKEFRENSSGAYQVASRKGWLNDYIWLDGKTEWTEDICLKEAQKYSRLVDFYSKSRNAYDKACKTGWIENYTWLKRREWSYEECKQESLKYKTRNEFKQGAVGAYRKSVAKKWIEEFYPKKSNNN